jgi:hypothetical protein
VKPGIFANSVAVIASVGKQRRRAVFVEVHQFVACRRIVRFARRDDESERETFAIGAGLNFARKTPIGGCIDLTPIKNRIQKHLSPHRELKQWRELVPTLGSDALDPGCRTAKAITSSIPARRASVRS